VLPSTISAADSLTVHNASSTHYTLTVMSWVALVFTPFVLLYQGWTYWVFRRRVSPEHIPPATGLIPRRLERMAGGEVSPPAADRGAPVG
jgi:cytochrome d ubiquinol oxidase subunit II